MHMCTHTHTLTDAEAASPHKGSLARENETRSIITLHGHLSLYTI